MQGHHTAYQAYHLYNSLHAHFTTKYDYFKYNGKMKSVSKEEFDCLNNHYMFVKLARHRDPVTLITQNHLYRDVKWVGDLFDDQAHEIFIKAVKYNNNIVYNYGGELKTALKHGDINTLLQAPDPVLLTLLMRKLVRFETVLILDNVLSFLDHWDRKIENNFLWPSYQKRLHKFRPFLRLDDKMLKIKTKEICLNSVHT